MSVPIVPASVRIADRTYIPGADRGVAVLLTAACWVLQRLPGQVVEHERSDLVKTLAASRDLVVEVHAGQAAILVRDGGRLLIQLPARTSRG